MSTGEALLALCLGYPIVLLVLRQTYSNQPDVSRQGQSPQILRFCSSHPKPLKLLIDCPIAGSSMLWLTSRSTCLFCFSIE